MHYKLLCTMVCESGVLTIYRGKLEIPVGKSNGSRHSVVEVSENMGCDLRRRNFLSLSSLFGKFGYTLWRFVLPPLACENIGFSSAVSSLFADVPPRETSPAAKSEDKTDVFAGYPTTLNYKISTRVVCVNGKHAPDQ